MELSTINVVMFMFAAIGVITVGIILSELWIGDIVRHFKHETLTAEEKAKDKYIYTIKGFALHASGDELMVVYQARYDDKVLYVRPIREFTSEVDHEKYPDIKQKYRFEVVGHCSEV